MTNSPSPKQHLQDIYQLIRNNKRQEARQLLQQFFKDNPPDADAYYISTFLTDDDKRKIQLCERALQINPTHGPATQLLDKLRGEIDARAALSDLIASFDDAEFAAPEPSPLPAPAPEPPAEPVRPVTPVAPTPFVDSWGEDKVRPSKANSGTSTSLNSALLFVGGLVLGILVASGIAVFAISRLANQPTPAPIVMIITATPLPSTPTRPPTFTPIPTRTPPTSVATSIPSQPTLVEPTLAQSTPLAPATINTELNILGFKIKDAEYSTQLDKIIIVTDGPNALFIYDPETQTQQMVALGRIPTCVSVSQDGNFAAVGHDALISYVDLRTAQVVKTLSLATTAADIVLLNSGWIAVMPLRDQWESVRMVQIDGNIEVAKGVLVYAGSYLVRDPDGVSFYYGTRGLSPEHIYHLVFDGEKVQSADWPYHGTYGFCGSFWVSESANRILGRCGAIFYSSDDATQDMTYAGSLVDVSSLEGVVHLAGQNKLLVLARAKLDNDTYTSDPAPLLLMRYDSDSLQQENAVTLPTFSDGKPADSGYLFMNAAGTRYYALLARNFQFHSNYRPFEKVGDPQFGIVIGDVT